MLRLRAPLQDMVMVLATLATPRPHALRLVWVLMPARATRRGRVFRRNAPLPVLVCARSRRLTKMLWTGAQQLLPRAHLQEAAKMSGR
jgi:hypothetical protein